MGGHWYRNPTLKAREREWAEKMRRNSLSRANFLNSYLCMYIAAHRDTETQDAYEISYVVRRDAFAMYRTIATRRGERGFGRKVALSPVSCLLAKLHLSRRNVFVLARLLRHAICALSRKPIFPFANKISWTWTGCCSSGIPVAPWTEKTFLFLLIWNHFLSLQSFVLRLVKLSQFTYMYVGWWELLWKRQ